MSQPKSLAEQLEALVNGGSRPTWDEYFMATAVLVSSRSSCERLHVGCIIVSTGKHPNRLVAAGYNGFLPGTPHDSKVRDGHEQATVHAEQNATIQSMEEVPNGNKNANSPLFQHGVQFDNVDPRMVLLVYELQQEIR